MVGKEWRYWLISCSWNKLAVINVPNQCLSKSVIISRTKLMNKNKYDFFLNHCVLLLMLLFLNCHVFSDDSIDADLELINKNLQLLLGKHIFNTQDKERLNNILVLMKDVYSRSEVRSGVGYAVLSNRIEQLKERIDRSMVSMTDSKLENFVVDTAAYVPSSEDKQFLYDKVPCDLEISLDEWQLRSLSSRRMDTIRCYFENAKTGIYDLYLSNPVAESNIKWQIVFNLYIKPNGSLYIFNKESNLPEPLVKQITNILQSINFPKISDNDFEVEYTFYYFPK